MLHLAYILAFTVIASFAISNLVRSLITLSTESSRVYPNHNPPRARQNSATQAKGKVHPELLDDNGRVINEPLLVMRSLSVEDARQQLDALYDSSPSKGKDPQE